MKRYPVFKALYEPIRTAGVPIPFLIIEIAFAIMFVVNGQYVVLIPILAIHISIATALKQDPYIVSILVELASIKDRKRDSDAEI